MTQQRKQNKEYYHNYYMRNRERILAQVKEYANTPGSREKRLAYQSQYSKTHKYSKEYYAAVQRKSRTGCPRELYEQLFQSQNGQCAICGKTANGVSLCADHDHVTGKVRALLCHNCNLMLGNAHDDPELLSKGIEYLNKFILENESSLED